MGLARLLIREGKNDNAITMLKNASSLAENLGLEEEYKQAMALMLKVEQR